MCTDNCIIVHCVQIIADLVQLKVLLKVRFIYNMLCRIGDAVVDVV